MLHRDAVHQSQSEIDFVRCRDLIHRPNGLFSDVLADSATNTVGPLKHHVPIRLILRAPPTAQNLTPHEVKTIITRAGENTKIILTGDIRQIDTPYLDEQSNGLTYVIDRLRGRELYCHIALEKGERSELANLANDHL